MGSQSKQGSLSMPPPDHLKAIGLRLLILALAIALACFWVLLSAKPAFAQGKTISYTTTASQQVTGLPDSVAVYSPIDRFRDFRQPNPGTIAIGPQNVDGVEPDWGDRWYPLCQSPDPASQPVPL